MIWSSLDSICNQGLNLVITTVLMTMLTPSDFGLVALCAIFMGVGMLLMDVGFGAAIIQSNNINASHLNSVFWANCALGLVLFLALFLASRFIASFYQLPEAELVLKLFALSLLLRCTIIVHSVLLKKKMDFRTVALISLTSVFLSGVVGIYLAFAGYGYWALVGSNLSATVLTAALYWFTGDWRPTFTYSSESIRELWFFSSRIFYAGLLHFVVQRLDRLIIGRALSVTDLGLYNNSISYSVGPIRKIRSKIGGVMFTRLSKLQGEEKTFEYFLFAAFRMMCAVIYPVGMIIFFYADVFVDLFFGSDWQDLSLCIRVLCIALIFEVGMMHSQVLNARGRAELNFRVILMINMVFLASIVCACFFGSLMAFVVAYAVSWTVSAFYSMWIVHSFLQVSMMTFLKPMAMYLMLSLFSLLVPFVFGGETVIVMILGALLGFFTYALLIYLVDTREVQLLKQLLVGPAGRLMH